MADSAHSIVKQIPFSSCFDKVIPVFYRSFHQDTPTSCLAACSKTKTPKWDFSSLKYCCYVISSCTYRDYSCTRRRWSLSSSSLGSWWRSMVWPGHWWWRQESACRSRYASTVAGTRKTTSYEQTHARCSQHQHILMNHQESNFL